MTNKAHYINSMQARTKKFAVDIIALCNTLKTGKSSSVISYQLIKSATSTGANYRAACRARSKNEFYSKLCIVVEEVDETQYWLEIIKETQLTENLESLNRLLRKFMS